MSHNEPIYLVTEKGLQDAIRVVVAEQINQLEIKLMKSNRILTREEAAFKASVSPNTISKWVREGLLINRGLGRKILIAEVDLDSINKRPGRGFINLN